MSLLSNLSLHTSRGGAGCVYHCFDRNVPSGVSGHMQTVFDHLHRWARRVDMSVLYYEQLPYRPLGHTILLAIPSPWSYHPLGGVFTTSSPRYSAAQASSTCFSIHTTMEACSSTGDGMASTMLTSSTSGCWLQTTPFFECTMQHTGFTKGGGWTQQTCATTTLRDGDRWCMCRAMGTLPIHVQDNMYVCLALPPIAPMDEGGGGTKTRWWKATQRICWPTGVWGQIDTHMHFWFPRRGKLSREILNGPCQEWWAELEPEVTQVCRFTGGFFNVFAKRNETVISSSDPVTGRK